jgi:hypothetical protein
VVNLPKEKPRLLFGLMPKIPDPVPEGILDLLVIQTRESSRDHQVCIPPVIPVNNDLKGSGMIENRNNVVRPHFKNGFTHFLPDR